MENLKNKWKLYSLFCNDHGNFWVSQREVNVEGGKGSLY